MSLHHSFEVTSIPDAVFPDPSIGQNFPHIIGKLMSKPASVTEKLMVPKDSHPSIQHAEEGVPSRKPWRHPRGIDVVQLKASLIEAPSKTAQKPSFLIFDAPICWDARKRDVVVLY